MGVHLERDRESGVVHWKQRTPGELPRELPEPDAEERDGRRQVEPVEAQLPGMEGRRDQPEEVHPPHEEEEPGDPDQLAEVVYVAGLEDFLHRSVPREEKAHDEGECEARDRLPADHVYAVDRREPVQVERHEAVSYTHLR